MTATLAEVCTITMGQAPTGDSYNDRGEGLPLIAGAGDLNGQTLAPTKFTTKPGKVSEAGDIILSIRASIGAKVWSDGEYCLGRGVAGLRPGPQLDEKYLWHWLTRYERDLASKGRGATFLQVNKTDIGEMRIQLPPLPEQRRIAAILDHADTLRTKRRQVLTKLDVLTKSIFNEMFGDPLTNPKGLPRATIGSVAAVVTGNSPSRADASNFGDSIEWIKSGNLGGDVASTADEWLSETGRAKARVAPPGSILVTCIAGSPTSIGKASLVDRDVAFNQQINAILPSDKIDTAFLLAQLKTAPKLVRAKSTGGMKGLVNKSAFQSIEIVLPGIDLQRGFAERTASLAGLQSIARSSLNAEDGLFASLQSRAFRGELCHAC